MANVFPIGNLVMEHVQRATSSVETIVGQTSTTGSVGINVFRRDNNAELMMEGARKFVTSLSTPHVEQPIVFAMNGRGNTTEIVMASVLENGNHVTGNVLRYL